MSDVPMTLIATAQLAERDAEIVELNRRFNAQSDNFVAASITIGQLRAEIAQLKAQVAELQANNADLRYQIESYELGDDEVKFDV